MKKMLLKILAGLSPRRVIPAANIAEGVHEGSLTLKADAASTTENLLVKFGTDASHYAIAGVSDKPIGTQLGTPAAAEEYCAIGLLGSARETRLMVASEQIAAGAPVFAAANGKVSDLPVGTGTYYQVGIAVSAASGDGELVEVDPCVAVPVVVA